MRKWAKWWKEKEVAGERTKRWADRGVWESVSNKCPKPWSLTFKKRMLNWGPLMLQHSYTCHLYGRSFWAQVGPICHLHTYSSSIAWISWSYSKMSDKQQPQELVQEPQPPLTCMLGWRCQRYVAKFADITLRWAEKLWKGHKVGTAETAANTKVSRSAWDCWPFASLVLWTWKSLQKCCKRSKTIK